MQNNVYQRNNYAQLCAREIMFKFVLEKLCSTVCQRNYVKMCAENYAEMCVR